MSKKPIKISRSTPIVPDLKILIRYENDVSKLTNFEKSLLVRMLNYFNGMIGAKTNVNYHIERVTNFMIRLPIYVYGNEESKMNSDELVKKRVNTILEFFKNFDWKVANKENLWLVRSLKIMKIDIENCFVLSVVKVNDDGSISVVDEPKKILISSPKLEYATIKRLDIKETYANSTDITGGDLCDDEHEDDELESTQTSGESGKNTTSHSNDEPSDPKFTQSDQPSDQHSDSESRRSYPSRKAGPVGSKMVNSHKTLQNNTSLKSDASNSPKDPISHITYYIDPYLQDFGLFIDLSVPFNDMGMSYNALHLYEHLMTKCWNDCDSKDVILLNGSTYPIGLSFIYTIHSSYSSLVHFLNKTIEFILKARDPKFWESSDMKNEIDLETERTISETRTERSLTSMGRSDFKAYDKKYDVNIFKYWSNLPFRILVTGNECPNLKLEGLVNLVHKNPLRHISRPPNVKLSSIPVDVLVSKNELGLYTKRLKTSDIIERIMGRDFSENVLFGVDAGLYSLDEDIGVYNSNLHPLLLLNSYFSDEELKEYVKTHVVSNSSKLLSMTSLQLKYECMIESVEE